MDQIKPKRRRILRSRKVVEWTARVEKDAHDYLMEICETYGLAKSKALTIVLRDHKKFGQSST